MKSTNLHLNGLTLCHLMSLTRLLPKLQRWYVIAYPVFSLGQAKQHFLLSISLTPLSQYTCSHTKTNATHNYHFLTRSYVYLLIEQFWRLWLSWCLQLRYISLTINDSPARGRCQHLFAAFLFGKKYAQNKSYSIILRSAIVLAENNQGPLLEKSR